jgi:hypothetical protein
MAEQSAKGSGQEAGYKNTVLKRHGLQPAEKLCSIAVLYQGLASAGPIGRTK